MRKLMLSAAIATLTMSGVSLALANAVTVLSPDGDPFPSDSELVLVQAGGPPAGYFTPLGEIHLLTASAFDGFSLTSGANEIFTYSPTVYVTFNNSGTFTTYAFPDAEVKVEIFDRSSTFESGTFMAEILAANASQTIDGQTVDFRLNPTMPSMGTVTFTSPPQGELGLLVETAFPYADTQFDVNHGPYTDAPSSVVEIAIPEPSTWAMMLLGLACLGYAGYRKAFKGPTFPA